MCLLCLFMSNCVCVLMMLYKVKWVCLKRYLIELGVGYGLYTYMQISRKKIKIGTLIKYLMMGASEETDYETWLN